MSVEVWAESPDRVMAGESVDAALARAVVDAGARRVMLVGSQGHPEGVRRMAAHLGDRVVATYLTTRPQVPREVADEATERARVREVDWLVAVGGGTPIGVAKAVALSLQLPIAALPSTYAGSERTNIWGIADGDTKTTGRDDAVRPRVVGYDLQAMAELPLELSLRSLLNALAHSTEALYGPEATERARQSALESLGVLMDAMGALVVRPTDLGARRLAARGAWLAAEALNGATMGLHHKLAHVLGARGLPHASVHATLLPYTLQLHLPHAPDLRDALIDQWGVSDPACHLYDRMRRWGLEVSLRELELPVDAVEQVVAEALRVPYDSPMEVTEAMLSQLVRDAWHGRRPSMGRRLGEPVGSDGPHGRMRVLRAGASLEEAEAVVIALHGRGANAERFVGDLEHALVGGLAKRVAFVAPQAYACSWYPKGFRAPVDDNQPWLDQSLQVVQTLFDGVVADGVPPERVLVVGFSQGACLALTWLGSTRAEVKRVLAFSGSHTPMEGSRFGAAEGAWVYVSRSVGDEWVPADAFGETVRVLSRVGATVDAEQVAGGEHRIHGADEVALVKAVRSVVQGSAP
jgi:maleylacetate reductase